MKVMISLQPQLKSIRHAPPGASCHRTHSSLIVALCGRPGGSERQFFDCVQNNGSVSVSSSSGVSMQTTVASRNGGGGHRHVHGSAFTWRGRRSILQSAASGMLGMVMWGGLLPSPRAAFATTSAITKNEVAEVLENPQWPEKFPFGPAAFERYDEMPDTEFYSYPRFVTHIDDDAIGALTDFYSNNFPASGSKEVAILDICSSWISHYPKGYSAGRISGLGMNEEELKRNDVLTDYNVKDLNEDPKLPYEDSTFDVITNCVSVDYLTKPLQIFSEMQRVLKPGRFFTTSTFYFSLLASKCHSYVLSMGG